MKEIFVRMSYFNPVPDITLHEVTSLTFSRFIVFLLSVLSLPVSAIAQEAKPKTPPLASLFSNLGLREIGPALTSGRIVAFAVHPTDPTHYYVAAGSGGVWKTTNNGTTWRPVFENEGSYSIGAVTLDPKNPNIVWVGTGELNAQRSVGYGDGVYKSENGGKTWKNLGLKNSAHIARIVIDPRDSNTVYVAAQGPLWSAGGDRGLYKTTDGGKTWKKVLAISDNTGVTDLVLDPRDPDRLYAAAWQRRRHVFTYLGGGPESAIYKSTDAGATWTKAQSGLPGGDLGRIGLALSPANPDYLYATVEASEGAGGIYRSTDYASSWEKRGSFVAQGMYYGQIIADPKDPERIYILSVMNMVSNDGGQTTRPLGERNKHVDNHALWIDPDNTRHYLAGCDGGVYESFDRGETWVFKSNLPLAQFYRVTTDNALPFYTIYGGTQDNNSLGGPSRTKSNTGITNDDWFITLGGDGFHQQVDPTDPNIVYSVLQDGGISRLNRKTNERVGIRPIEGKGEPALRWNWDSPLLISPHAPSRLYFAANKLFRSNDRGSSWTAISPDLTRQIDRNLLTIMGRVWKVDAIAKGQSTSYYGNIVALDESPKQEGVIYVGTDDGLIQVTEDGGKTWRKIETFPGVPAKTYVSYLTASAHERNTVYAGFENHKEGDFAPYLLKSTDAGRTWTAITGDLPKHHPILVIKEDPVIPNLLFVGTEFGAFFSLNGGVNWQKFGGLPTIPVRDIALQKREGDLVFATFGRGFYVLDDFAPLRYANAEMQAKDAFLFPVRSALLYNRTSTGTGSQGETYFAAPNPPDGALITYYLKDSIKTRKQKRLEAEAEAEKQKTVPPYPTPEQLLAEEQEDPPSLVFTITDEDGQVVRRLTAPASAGVRRLAWDLRGAPVSASPSGTGRGGGGGFFCMPGLYRVSLAKRVNGSVTEIAEPVAVKVVAEGEADLKPSERKALTELRRKVARLQNAVTGASATLDDSLNRLAVIKQAVQDAPQATAKLREQSVVLAARFNEVSVLLRGNPQYSERTQPEPPSVADRVFSVSGALRGANSLPTQTVIASYSVAASEFKVILAKLRTLVKNEMPKLEDALDKAGVPYTPGRIPEWKD
jgi:photosystem II stability/assembly factor-like uncharacterized protein